MQTVLKFFAGILSLGASRKIFIAIVTAGFVALNAKLGWQIPAEPVAGIVVIAVALIIAIAVEDAAAKKKHVTELIDMADSLIEELQEKRDVAGIPARPAAGGAEGAGNSVTGSDAG